MTVDAFRCWRPAAVLAHFQARLGRKLCAKMTSNLETKRAIPVSPFSFWL
ncbi:hypothetical protein NKH24_32680 [Mesorhizobium sp. M1300]